MVDASTEAYLEGRIKRAQEGRPLTLQNNASFFEQFSGQDLELARKVYNYVIDKVNWQGHKYAMPADLPDSETKKGLAEKLTDFQAGVDNLDRK